MWKYYRALTSRLHWQPGKPAYDRTGLQGVTILKYTKNNHLFQSLSNFQRDVVSYKDEKKILSALLQASVSTFPLSGATILSFARPLTPANLTFGTKFEVISLQGSSKPLNLPFMQEVKGRWQEFSTQEMLVGEKNNWLALPLRSFGEKLTAVFIIEVHAGTKIMEFVDTLSLFVSFSEQVLQGLSSLRLAEKNLQHITSLYEAVEMISMQEDPQDVIDLFAVYARALTGCEKVIFWVEGPPGPQAGEKLGSFYAVKGKKMVFPEDEWRTSLLQAWSEMRNTPRPLIKEVETGSPSRNEKGLLVCVPVKTRARCFGMLAALEFLDRYDVEEVIQTLSFLAELGAISIERSMADLFTDKLLLIGEQNRIANEIHDGISQNLFSIVYGLDAFHKKTTFLIKPEQRKTLATIRDLAAQTARELRQLIHRLSPRHREDDTFLKEIRAYLNSMARLNNLSVDFQVSGREEYLNQTMRWAFYRMIKEATGNAVRHGECSEIIVELEMNPFSSDLKIVDNGRGFDVSLYNKPSNTSGKLGLVNMRELALTLRGTLNIKSKKGKGTIVHCSVPAASQTDKVLPN